MELSFTLDEIEAAAQKFLSITNDYNVFGFHGNLGAGKTTFIGSICRQLGVKENISSPTFSIIHEYATKSGKIIYHIDLYRIKNELEAIQAGVEDCFYSSNKCFIEWPEKAFSILPLNTVQVFIETVDQTERKVSIKLP